MEPTADQDVAEREPQKKRRKRSFTTRHAESRAKLANQPWPEFFRDLAIRAAVIAVVVGLVVLAVWLITR